VGVEYGEIANGDYNRGENKTSENSIIIITSNCNNIVTVCVCG
jgi:hypothetical protein